MKCPKCGTQMTMVDIPKVDGNRITVWLECPNCHFRMPKEQ